jgi:single-strand DNA-binding protein
MPYLNRAEIMGNLGQTPEVRYTAERLPVTNLSVATNRRFKRANSDKWEDEVTWHTVVVFGSHAETCATHLTQGDRVYVEGRLQTRESVARPRLHGPRAD